VRTLRNRAAIVAPVALLALGAAACGGSSTTSTTSGSSAGPATVKSGGEITYGSDQEPPGYNNNTSKDNNTAVTNIEAGILPSVFRIQPDNSLKLNSDVYASAELTSSDPETVVYKIKPEAIWNDGTPVSADDFIYMWQNMNGSIADNDINSTAGYEDVGSVTGSDDGKTVTVVFKNKYPDWKALFSSAGGNQMLEAKVMKTLPGGWNTGLDKSLPFSAGPYKLESYTPGSNAILVRNDKWFGKKPNLDRIIVRFLPQSQAQVAAMQNNEVQVIYPQPQLDDVAKAKTIAGVTTEINFGQSFEHLDFNFKNTLLADAAVRKAIATGMSDDEIVNSGVKQFSDKAKPLGNRIWLTGQSPYVDQSGSYAKGNTAAATKLLEDAGYQKGTDGIYAKNGQRLSFRFSTTSGNKLREDTGVLFQNQMKKMGVDIQIDNKASKVLFPALSKGDFDISLFAWVGSPFTISSNKGEYVTGGGSNYGKYSSPKVDALFTQATSEFDEKKVADLGNQIDKELWSDVVTVPLYQKPTFIAYYSKYGNIHDNPNQEGPLYNVGDWGLK
jgi:peptide/nickel transport system substrate-binding protein